jgi:hypothetical protein
MGLENTNTIAIIKQTKHQVAYIPFMQSVPCLRISERPVRVSSDHNTRWRLPYSQKQITRKQGNLKNLDGDSLIHHTRRRREVGRT